MTEEDKGEITCRVKNSQGTITHSIELEVYSKYHRFLYFKYYVYYSNNFIWEIHKYWIRSREKLV